MSISIEIWLLALILPVHANIPTILARLTDKDKSPLRSATTRCRRGPDHLFRARNCSFFNVSARLKSMRILLKWILARQR
jgi:hypothetical protein